MKYLLESVIYSFIIDVIFSKLNINIKDAQYLGKGTLGVAYLYDGKVYKITTDPAEVELAYILLGKNLEHYVDIYDIYCHDTDPADENKYDDNMKYYAKFYSKPRYYWVIIEEYLPKLYHMPFNELNDFNMFVAEKKYNPSEKDLFSFLNSFDEEDEEDDSYSHIELMVNLYLELKQYGIQDIGDIKSFGYGNNGELKFIDLRFEIGEDKNINTIKKL